MKKLVTAAALLAAIAPASAADMPAIAKAPQPVQYLDAFSGFYAGAHIGYGFDESGVNGALDIVPISGLRAAPQGVVGGLQAGYGDRFGNGKFYGGIETDVTLGNLRGSAAAPGLLTATSKDDVLGSTRLRLGFFLLPNLLVYGSAGVAYGDPTASFTLATLPTPTTFSASNTKVGWTAGVGVEAALNEHWLVRAEWVRDDLGHVTVTAAPTIAISTPIQVDLFRGGISYKF